MTRALCLIFSTMLLIRVAMAQGLGPAATVGDIGIPRSRVEAQVNHLINTRGMGSGGITQPSTYRQFQEEVLEQLIVQELLWQEAQDRDFVVSSDTVDQELAALKESFETDTAFQFKIREGGYTEETFRENIRQQKSVQQMIAQEIIPSIEIDEATLNGFYERNIAQMQLPERIRARHILIKSDPTDAQSRTMAAAKLKSIQQRLENGESFALLALENSEGPSASRGGDLGFFGRGQMVAPFEQVVFSMQPGEISDIVETEFGLHLIKVEERHESGTASLAEAAPQIRSYLAQQALEGTLASLVDSLRAERGVTIHLW